MIDHILLGCNKECKLKYTVKQNELKQLHEENCIDDIADSDLQKNYKWT